MKYKAMLILSILFPVFTANSKEEKPAESIRKDIERNVKEKSLHEKLSEKGRVTTKEAADGGRTTGNGRTTKVGKDY